MVGWGLSTYTHTLLTLVHPQTGGIEYAQTHKTHEKKLLMHSKDMNPVINANNHTPLH